ncbi:MAG TPA: GWxTD domain-containing protein [Gemmatimonadaceae bacterium]|nr:GWxTD domain-containing protein [Gemmatimonadaceae bacterium]
MRMCRGRPSLWLIAAATIVAGCGGTQRLTDDPAPRPEPTETALVDSLPRAGDIFRRAGLIVPDSGTIPFVATVRYLAGATPDSTLALVAMSLSNRALTFVPEGTRRVASYGVAITVTQNDRPVVRMESVDTVQVATFREASRSDESIIFRRYVPLSPGTYRMTLAVRDESGTRQSAQSVPLTVPRLGPGGVSSPVTIYQGTPRSSTDSLPQLIPNTRSLIVFGRDSTVPIYLEGYGLPPDARVVVSVANADQVTLWDDTLTLPERGALRDAILDLPVADLGLGRVTVRASVAGSPDTVETPVFVSFGEQWALDSFDDVLSLLRYFATAARLQALRDAPPADRTKRWAEFLRETDSNPRTPEHEALEAYFERLARANDTFRERDRAGWLTDRGRVLATLGEPDQVLQDPFAGGATSTRSSTQIWVYYRYQLRLAFTRQSGATRWRLDPASATRFDAVAQQVRVH